MASLNGIFDAVSYTSPKVSTFNGNHDIKTSCKIGEVFPLDVVPVYPRDSFKMKYNLQAKFSPLVAPAFQRMSLKQWSFYVKNSDLWDDFNEFVTGVNPKLGKTAYDVDSSITPSHPYFPMNKGLMCGSSYIGVKLNLSNIPIENALTFTKTDDGTFIQTINVDIFKQILETIKADPKAAFSYEYYDGSELNTIYPFYNGFLKNSEYRDSHCSSLTADLIFDSSKNSIGSISYGCFVGTAPLSRESNISSNSYKVVSPLNWYNCIRSKGFKPLFSPGSLFDYLGFPCQSDLSYYVHTDEFKLALRDYFKDVDFDSPICQFIETYLVGRNGEQPTFSKKLFKYCDVLLSPYDNSKRLSYSDQYTPILFPHPCPSVNEESGDISFWDLADMEVPSEGDFALTCQNSLSNIIVSYLVWMAYRRVNTTMVFDCPCFAVLPMSAISVCSDEHVDSLRIRGYFKIWNDYFREPNLTAEIPIPYDQGGNDFWNFYRSVFNYLDRSSDFFSMLDWKRRYIYKQFLPYFHMIPDDVKPSLTSDYYMINYFKLLCLWDLLLTPFKHLRNRDYLTGCLPNTSVVDVVAPIMDSSFGIQSKDSSNSPYTNQGYNYNTVDGYILDSSKISPKPVSEVDSAVGWLDIENLRITQKLKQYFTSLRHTMAGIKDYIKVFFDVDIDDASLHRSVFLGGNQQFVNVSELVSNTETDSKPQGSLAGRATSYGESGYVNEFIKEHGFIITLECLSPIVSNVGGLTRQLIRDTRFDYFNPMFAELGDMSVLKKEVTCMPFIGNSLECSTSAREFFDSTFGYTQRYMDLKFIESKVHGDFLGSLADWHLDLIQKPFNKGDSELSQSFLEERSDDRIFSEVFDDASNVYIWCECDCVFQRALPAVIREVIA